MKRLFLLMLLGSLGMDDAPAMESKSDSIVLMNPFSLKAGESEIFLSRWKAVAEYMRTQPGFIETTLHQGIQDKTKWFNFARWKSAEDFKRAVSTPEFKKLTEKFPGEGKPTLYSVQEHLK